nr:MAG TPA: hypothetical protein [Caudoviricetes sp.]
MRQAQPRHLWAGTSGSRWEATPSPCTTPTTTCFPT